MCRIRQVSWYNIYIYIYKYISVGSVENEYVFIMISKETDNGFIYS